MFGQNQDLGSDFCKLQKSLLLSISLTRHLYEKLQDPFFVEWHFLSKISKIDYMINIYFTQNLGFKN